MIRIGIPRATRRLTSEKYPTTPVITLSPAPTEKGKTWRITVNKRGLADLSYDMSETNYISLVRDYNEDDVLQGIGFANTTNFTDAAERTRMNKSGTFTSKQLYNYLAEYYNLDTSIENELELTYPSVLSQEGDPRYMLLKRINNNDGETDGETSSPAMTYVPPVESVNEEVSGDLVADGTRPSW